MNRRDFLKLAGTTIGLSIPLLGGSWWLTNRGDTIPSVDPYAPDPWEVTSTSSPVLLLINEDPSHQFGRFLAEILWAEGLNAFTAIRLADATSRLLSQYACVLVSAGKCSSAQTAMLANYAAAGGNLIVFQPDDALAETLGLGAATGAINESAIITIPQHPLADGIVSMPLNIHVEANLYRVEGADIIARLEDKDAHPGVFINRLGSGLVSVWAFDLPMAIVLIRQGNPEMALGADDLPLQRPVDLFNGWIDFDRMRYPQADELQRLLAGLITWLCRDFLPLPRFWYFPGDARCLLVASSDAHRNTISALSKVTGLFEQYSGGVTLNYTPPLVSGLGLLKFQGEAIGARMEVLPSPYFPTPEQFAGLRSHGHEITMHPLINDTYVDSWSDYWSAFTRMGYGPVTPTVRTHNLEWRGWADAARIQASFGYRMNTDYYQYGPLFSKGNNDWFFGHFTGSGLPMRFADENGRMLSIYQQVTQFGDERFFQVPWIDGGILGPARGVQIVSEFMQSSINGYFAATTINYHADPFDLGDNTRLPATELLNGTLAEAHRLGVPIWTVQHWLNFTTMRQKARFEKLHRQDKKIIFDVTSDETAGDGLSVLIPLDDNQSALQSIRLDGHPAPFKAWKVGGVKYGLVTLHAGSHHLDAEYQ